MNPNHIGTNFDDFLKEEGIIMKDRFKFRIFDYDDNKMHDVIEIMYREDNTVVEWLNSEDKKRSAFIGEVPTVQCTGLKDKNGKLIYEGDICKYKFEEIGEQKAIIYFSKELCSFLAKPLNDFQYTRINDCEVIGNIYENKELLNDR